ncbi:TPA: hypothetical protein ACT9K3_002632 [Legionella pneumophila]|nr:hypothetical protein [Legionella pneumophila]HAU0818046.1 hypothetical protein [Legionella pneumophila]
MNIPSHPDKDIKKAIKEAMKYGWTFDKLGKGGNSHAWGQITCPAKMKGFNYSYWCKIIICSTPRNPSQIAQNILKKVMKCVH